MLAKVNIYLLDSPTEKNCFYALGSRDNNSQALLPKDGTRALAKPPAEAEISTFSMITEHS